MFVIEVLVSRISAVEFVSSFTVFSSKCFNRANASFPIKREATLLKIPVLDLLKISLVW